MVQKNAYYTSFDNEKFIGAKELLKRMPIFYNKVYFASNHANTLWSNDREETFSNITLLCKKEDITSLRQIIKNNFLYINDFDSLKYGETDFGFSFIGANILFIVAPFEEIEQGYIIRSFDYINDMCSETTLNTNKETFLVSSINELGEIIKICDFKLADMTETNTKKIPIKRKQEPEMIVYDKKGYAMTNAISLISITLVCLALVFVITYFMK